MIQVLKYFIFINLFFVQVSLFSQKVDKVIKMVNKRYAELNHCSVFFEQISYNINQKNADSVFGKMRIDRNKPPYSIVTYNNLIYLKDKNYWQINQKQIFKLHIDYKNWLKLTFGNYLPQLNEKIYFQYNQHRLTINSAYEYKITLKNKGFGDSIDFFINKKLLRYDSVIFYDVDTALGGITKYLFDEKTNDRTISKDMAITEFRNLSFKYDNNLNPEIKKNGVQEEINGLIKPLYYFNYRSKKNTVYNFVDSGDVIIDFWHLQCAPCILSIPELEKISEAHKFKVLSVNILNDSTDICYFCTKRPGNFPIAKYPVFNWVNLDKSITPQYWIIKNGILKKIIFGYSGHLELDIAKME
jgi:thiol-disulfide isomerase/thioredoxin